MSTSGSSERRESTCPYAVALHEPPHDEDASTGSSNDDGSDHHHHPQDLVEETMQKCPAFSDASCPFKDAKSPEAVREQLLSMPKSHWQDTTVSTMVQKLHQVHPSSDDTNKDFSFPGGCPVQPVVNQVLGEQEEEVSFAKAMESLSLASIMARMASREMDDEAAVSGDELSEGSDEISQEFVPPEAASTTPPESSDHEPQETANILSSPPRSPPRPRQQRRLLAESLKEGTAVSHQAAEDVHFVKNFIKGQIDRDLYARLVVQLYHVYNALEACLDQAAPEHFGTCHFPEQLARKEALLEDLDFWHGSKNVEDLAMSDATKDYVDRLHELATTDPLLLLAHSYTRYLGDLSGGKILARVARKALMLDKDGEGLAFYEFPKIPSAKRFKDSYRQAMDALPLTTEEISKLVAEANVAFVLNMRIFEELDVLANIPGAKVRSLSEALEFANDGRAQDISSAVQGRYSITGMERKEATAASKECPFSTLNTKDDAGGTVATPAHAGSGSSVAAAKPHAKQGHCPWPFILMHDPVAGLSNWKTWALVGLILALCWNILLHRTMSTE